MFPEPIFFAGSKETRSEETAKMIENTPKSFLLFIIILLNLLIVKIIKSYIHRTEKLDFKRKYTTRKRLFTKFQRLWEW